MNQPILPGLVLQAQAGDRAAAERLVERMRPAVKAISRRFFLPGAEHDDVIQAGLIGVFRGIRTYRPGLSRDVHGYLAFCAERGIITALKEANRMKHRSLTEAVSLERTLVPGSSFEQPATLHDLLPGGADPADRMEQTENLRELVDLINGGLTGLERGSLLRVVNGEPYPDEKTVDNAVQRARRKLRLAMAA